MIQDKRKGNMSEQRDDAAGALVVKAALRLWPFIALLKGKRVGIENSAVAYDAAQALENALLDYLDKIG